MLRKIISGMMLTLLLTSMLTLAFNIQSAKPEERKDLTWKVVSSFSIPGESLHGLAFDGRYLWVSDMGGFLYKVDPSNGSVAGKYSSKQSSGLTYIDGYLWGCSWYEYWPKYKLLKFNLTGYCVETYDLPDVCPAGLAYDGTYLWIVFESGSAYIDKIIKTSLPPENNTFTFMFYAPCERSEGLAWRNGYLWVSGYSTLYQMNPTNGDVVGVIDIPFLTWITGLTFDNLGFLWVLDHDTNTLYKILIGVSVPEDYPTIQEAINAASQGDIVYVSAGTYYEHVFVNKSVSLIGENRKTTIIDGNNTGIIVQVMAPNCTVIGFTIQRGSFGIKVESASVLIKNNIVTNNTGDGVFISSSSENNTISGNVVAYNNGYGLFVFSRNNIINNQVHHNSDGIGLRGYGNSVVNNNVSSNARWGVLLGDHWEVVYDNLIRGNYIENNGYYGVAMWEAYNNTIENNVFLCNSIGINMYSPTAYGICEGNVIVSNLIINSSSVGVTLRGYKNLFSKNTVKWNDIGISLYGDSLGYIIGNYITYNNVIDNRIGINAVHGIDNFIHHNNFVNNTNQVYLSGNNNWDDGYPSGGNYWSDYTGVDLYSGPYQNETGSDGIGDTPYVIDENNIDRYPLMAPIETFNVGVWNGTSYNVDVVSNSTVSHLKFNPYEWPPSVEFNVTGLNGTSGFCKVAIPKPILWAEENGWRVIVGGEEVNYTSYFDEENTYLYFTYMHSTKKVLIQGTQALIPFYNLTITSTEGGTTDPTPGIYTYANGTQVSVTAIPHNGFSFDCWLLDGEKGTENPITITMDSNHTLEAYFVDDIPPELGDPWQEPPPENVQPNHTVTVWVNVTDYGSGIKNVTLWYSLDNGTTWETPINMTALPIPSDTTITYKATIPGYENCTWITYKIVAYDKAGNNATKDNNGYGYKYHVIPEFPSTTILTLLMLTALIATILLKRKRKPKTQLA